MATTTFSITQAAGAVWGGSYTDTTVSGSPARATDTSSTVDLVVTGTALAVGIYDYPLNYTVDGGAVQSYTGNTSARLAVPIFSGLADGPHTVHISCPYAMRWDTPNFAVVTGAAPAVSTPAGMGPAYVIQDCPGISVDGSLDAAGNVQGQRGYHNDFGGAYWGGGQIRFRATCTGVQVFAYAQACTFGLLVDGVDLGVRVSPTGSVWGWVPIASGLDGTTEHEYTILQVGTGNVLTWASAVMAAGGTLNTTALTPWPTWAFYGDSITMGQGLADTTVGFPHLIASVKKVGVRNLGIPGSHVINVPTPQGTDGSVRTAQVTGLSPAPARVVVMYGTNDAIGIAQGTETTAELGAAYQTMIEALVTGLPASTPVDCLTYLPFTVIGDTARAANLAAITAAVAAVSPNAAVRLLDTSSWINPATDLQGDNIHPTAGGDAKIAAAYLATFAMLSGRCGLRGLVNHGLIKTDA